MNRLINAVIVLGIGAAVVASFIYLGIDLGELGDSGNLHQMGAYAQRFLSPDLSAKHLAAIQCFRLGERHQFVKHRAVDPRLQPWADGDVGAWFAAHGVKMHTDRVVRIGGHHFIQIGAEAQALARCAIPAITMAPEELNGDEGRVFHFNPPTLHRCFQDIGPIRAALQDRPE
mgnify:CR=1 FL=1